MPLRMSSDHVTPHTEVHTIKFQPNNLDLPVVNGCNNPPPPTEAYRSQQFMDITNDMEGPPPYQNDIADSFIVIRDINHLLSLGTARRLVDCGVSSPAKANQDPVDRDFILFQDEVLRLGDISDISSSDTFSSQVSCCSDVGMDSSTESFASGASSASAIEEQQRRVPVDLSQSDAISAPDVNKPTDMGRLFDWLQSILPLSEEAVPTISTPG